MDSSVARSFSSRALLLLLVSCSLRLAVEAATLAQLNRFGIQRVSLLSKFGQGSLGGQLQSHSIGSSLNAGVNPANNAMELSGLNPRGASALSHRGSAQRSLGLEGMMTSLLESGSSPNSGSTRSNTNSNNGVNDFSTARDVFRPPSWSVQNNPEEELGGNGTTSSVLLGISSDSQDTDTEAEGKLTNNQSQLFGNSSRGNGTNGTEQFPGSGAANSTSSGRPDLRTPPQSFRPTTQSRQNSRPSRIGPREFCRTRRRFAVIRRPGCLPKTVSVTSCGGRCSSRLRPKSLRANRYESLARPLRSFFKRHCRCCKATDIRQEKVMLHCPGEKEEEQIALLAVPQSCSCQSC